MAYYIHPNFTGTVNANSIIWEDEGEILQIEPYGPDAIRVRATRSLRIDEKLNWMILPPKEPSEPRIEKFQKKASLKNGNIIAEITGDGTISFFRRDGSLLLEESWIDGRVNNAPCRRAREYKTLAGDTFRIEQYFKPNKAEHFYGMGQNPNDCFDLKGSTVELLQKNTKCTIPFAYSSMGYGFLWNNPSIGRTEFGTNHTLWNASAARQIDYIIISGNTPTEIIGKYTEITGRASVIPRWALGFWQSKLRYENQEEVLQVAREYNKRGIPLSIIVIDYFHWTQQGEWKFDPQAWSDPAAMVRELEEMGTKVMVSVWPTVDPRSENYFEMKRKNYLIKAERGVPVTFMFYGPETYYDATHPGAREYLWSKIQKNYYSKGIKTFWLDEAEPEMRPYDYDNVRYYLGNGQEVSNIYPVLHAKAFYDGMKKEGEKEILNLVRCAWHGTQRFDAVVWSGDVESSFDSLRKQMKAGLHIALCGIPWWTTDIGGFINGDPESPEFRELLIRWFQYGAFCPIFRIHGYRLPYKVRELYNPDAKCYSGGPNEIWSFGKEVYEILLRYIRLRERLIPYIMTNMEEASRSGTPVMRPLLFDFPEDPEVYDKGDEYMLGPSLLVAPIIEAGARTRTVYLPISGKNKGNGEKWIEVSNGIEWEGGSIIEAVAPIDTIPLFIRGGADPTLQKLLLTPGL